METFLMWLVNFWGTFHLKGIGLYMCSDLYVMSDFKHSIQLRDTVKEARWDVLISAFRISKVSFQE